MRKRNNPIDLEYYEPFRMSQTALWRAVIMQAAQDHDKDFFSPTKDFFMVCHLADLSPEAVLLRWKQIAHKKIQWRLPAGQGPRYIEQKNRKHDNANHRIT